MLFRSCSYADDNHLSNDNTCIATLKSTLEQDADRSISWFDDNGMNANADKFQCIALDRNGKIPLSISVQGRDIPSSDKIKVLGVTLDSKLRFDPHVSSICAKASIQINALKRLSST